MKEQYFSQKNMLSFSSKVVLFRHSKLFRGLSIFIIIAYSIILGVKSHGYSDTYSLFFAVTDYAVTLFFIIELIIKLYSEKNKREFFKDNWNIFDTFIIIASLIPTETFESILIARLFRVFRVLRLISVNDNIKKLLVALEGAIPHIFNILLLMFIVFYIYAIVGTQLFSTLQSGLWDNFSISMLTLFRILTFEDWTDVMYEAMELSPYYWIYFVSFVIINAFVIFNLFVAVIINEISKIKDNDINNALDTDAFESQIILSKLDGIEKRLKKLDGILQKGKE